MAANRRATRPTRIAKPAFDKREQEVVGLKEIIAERDRQIGALEHRQEEADERVAEARAAVNALKAELVEAKAIIARQAGYLDRVGEDDRIREGDREIPTVTTERMVQRVGPLIEEHSVRAAEHDRAEAAYASRGMVDSKLRPAHWRNWWEL